jgi:cell division protein YceG involved in septum cleavage
MNTEINFLEKVPNKNSASIVLGIIFLLLLLIVIIVLLFQKSNYDNQLVALEGERTQVEAVLIEQQNTHGTARQLERLQEELVILESEMLLAVELYHDIIGLLSGSEQLNTHMTSGQIINL